MKVDYIKRYTRTQISTDSQTIKPMETKLTPEQKKALAQCKSAIRSYCAGQTEDFHKLVAACYVVQRDVLYCEHGTEAAFFKAEFGFSRSHSLRLASMGRLIDRVSPTGDTVKVLASDAHLRPLLKLDENQQDAVIAQALAWMKMANLANCPAKLVGTARTFLNPPKGPREQKTSTKAKLVGRFKEVVAEAKSKLPAGLGAHIATAIQHLDCQVKEMSESILSTTGISWTDATWNPLHGCSRASKGCDNCYAAKVTATRLTGLYPGLAVKKKTTSGKTTYAFTGKIQMVPQDLAEPLNDCTPKRYFVNSMSDLFHQDVPEEFIDAVFTVMEAAHWHVFQVLTKRPERMAVFTQKRYTDKAPPVNIWLGTSTEDQSAYDARMPHLKNAKAAVRWLSCEPLLGPIQFGDTDSLSWVVVGGESGAGARKMTKEWASGIRDTCKSANVPFFFKQWGAYNEAGKKEREKNNTPTMDGVDHKQYPNQEM